MFVYLTKAFEMVRLEDAWRAGVASGFPMRILRASRGTFAFARCLSYRKSVADPVYSLSAILAGSGVAQVALTTVQAGPLRHILGAFPQRVFCEHSQALAVGAPPVLEEPSL